MAKEMIISSNGFERKIAILEDGVLKEYYVERVGESEVLVGNIYKGRVTKVLPGMQSAFIDIGLERDAFLYIADVFEGEVEEIEYEPAKRQTKAATARAPKAAVKPAVSEPPLVSEEEAEEIFEAMAEATSALPRHEREAIEEARPTYDEQVAELIESLAGGLTEPGAETVDADSDTEIDLKDAIVEEKIIEAVHQEEMQIEPASRSEVRVGSLQIEFPTDFGLERIVDEPLPAEAAESTAEVALPEEPNEAATKPAMSQPVNESTSQPVNESTSSLTH